MLKVTRFQAIRSIALALDNVANAAVTSHAIRVAGITYLIVQELNFSDQDVQFMVECALLHDIGVATQREHQLLISVFDNPNTRSHCTRGGNILRGSDLLHKYHKVVEFHHTPCWDLKLYPHLSALDRLFANIIFAADRAAIVYDTKFSPNKNHSEEHIQATLIASVRGLVENYFFSEIVDAFSSAITRPGLESNIAIESVSHKFDLIGEMAGQHFLDKEEFLQFAHILSQVVDGRGCFSRGHSSHVAQVSTKVGTRMALDPEDLNDLYLAALIHDIGLLKFTEHSLHSLGKNFNLSQNKIDQICFDTNVILKPVCGDSQFLDWVISLYTKIDNNGLHLNSCENLPLPFQILVACHLFQVLVEQSKNSNEQMTNQIIQAASQGKLNQKVVSILTSDLAYFTNLATADNS